MLIRLRLIFLIGPSVLLVFSVPFLFGWERHAELMYGQHLGTKSSAKLLNFVDYVSVINCFFCCLQWYIGLLYVLGWMTDVQRKIKKRWGNAFIHCASTLGGCFVCFTLSSSVLPF